MAPSKLFRNGTFCFYRVGGVVEGPPQPPRLEQALARMGRKSRRSHGLFGEWRWYFKGPEARSKTSIYEKSKSVLGVNKKSLYKLLYNDIFNQVLGQDNLVD